MLSRSRHMPALERSLLHGVFPLVLCLIALYTSGCVQVKDDFSAFNAISGLEFARESIGLDVGYEPTPMPVVKAILDLAQVGPKDFLVDLGSGDGRIVIAAAKAYGVRGYGVDLNPKLVALSRHYAERNGVTDKASFEVRDLFMTDLSRADVVTLYLLPDVNRRLRPKLWKELRPGTRIVSHDYHLGDWRPDSIILMDVAKSDREDSLLYAWTMPARISGNWQWQVSLPGANGLSRGDSGSIFRISKAWQALVKNDGPFLTPNLMGNGSLFPW